MQNDELKITVIENGPFMVEGACKVEKLSGELIKEDEVLYLCRCGESSAKPFCDGTHNKINFKAE